MTKPDNNRHARQVAVSRVKKEDCAAENTPRRTVTARIRAAEPPAVEEVRPEELQGKEAAEAAAPETVSEPADCVERPAQETAGKDSEPTSGEPVPESDADHQPDDVPPEPVTDEEGACGEETAVDSPPAEEPPKPEPTMNTPEPVDEKTDADHQKTESPDAGPPAVVLTGKEEATPTAAAATPETVPEITPVSPPAAQTVSPAAPEPSDKVKWYIPQKWEEITTPRRIVMILSTALFLFSFLPLLVGILSPGIIPPALIAMFFFGCALYWPAIEGCESVLGNVIIAVVAVCVLAGVSYLAFVSGKMISASANTLPEDTSEVTVVVLGCRVKGDQPSLMLTARLEKAAEFLLEHPQAHCIVTGGQGPDEDYPEAQVMKNYLVNKGVSPMRIIMESTSTSTLENITNASALAKQYNCHERFLIVTDRFHQYRAMSIANDLGVVSYALNVETVWYLAMQYWFREIAAITRDWVVA